MKGSTPNKTSNLTEINYFIGDSKESANEIVTLTSKDLKLYPSEGTVSYFVSAVNCEGKFHVSFETSFSNHK